MENVAVPSDGARCQPAAGGGPPLPAPRRRKVSKTRVRNGVETRTTLLGFAHYVRNPGKNYWVLRPRWGAFGALVVAVVLLVWFAVAGYVYWFNRYILGCERTSFANMLVYVLPNRIPRTEIVIFPEFLNNWVVAARNRQSANLSDMWFDNPRSVLHLIWAASASPSNIEAQFQAAYYMASPDWLDRFQDGFTLLDSTLPTIMELKDPVEIRRNLMRYAQFCAQYDQDIRIIRAAETYLDDPRMPADARKALATTYAEALFLRGDFTKASAVLSKYKLLGNLSGFLLNARIIWENGEQERALRLLRKFISETADGKDKLLYAYAKCCWERGDKAGAVSALRQIIAAQPDEFRPSIYLLGLLNKPEDKAEREQLFADFLSKFGASENAMLSAGSYAADHGEVEMQNRINALAFEHRFKNLASFRLLQIETLLSAGRHEQVLLDIGDLITKKPNWLREKRTQEQFEALRMLAYFGAKDSGSTDIAIVIFRKLVKTRLSQPMLIAISRRLLALGRPEEARQLLLDAYTQNPYNQGLLLELVKLDLKSDKSEDLGEHLRYLVDARRPPRYVIEQAYAKMGGDKYLFAPGRDKLLEDLDEMLTKRVLPKTELEKGWDDELGVEKEGITPKLGS